MWNLATIRVQNQAARNNGKEATRPPPYLVFEAEKKRLSQREFAEKNGIPRTTLQHWMFRKESIDAPRELVDFLESPCGQWFLHRIILAAHFEFCKNGPASIHNVGNSHELQQGLRHFVAAIVAPRNAGFRSNTMDKAIISFGQSERKRLAEGMPVKWITLCEDETFHPAVCLVAIEAASNFIVLEEYVESRDGATWNDAVVRGTEGLNVRVVQVSADEAKGIRNHTERGLGAHHSPDVFHVLQEAGKGISGPPGR